jgi:ribosome-associated protein
MPYLPLRGDHLTLAQALKAAGLVDSGGQAKHLIRGGSVHVNDVLETRPGRKLFLDDRFRIAGGDEWLISQEGS